MIKIEVADKCNIECKHTNFTEVYILIDEAIKIICQNEKKNYFEVLEFLKYLKEEQKGTEKKKKRRGKKDE